MGYRYKFLVVLVCLGLFLQPIIAQNDSAAQLLNKVKQAYEDMDGYHIDITYTMYQGLTGSNITESYKGAMKRQKNNLFFSVLGSQIFQSGGEQITVNNKDKTLKHINKGEEGFQGSLLDFGTFLTFYNKTTISQKGDMIICELLSSSSNSLIQTTPYSKIVLYIDKATYLIKKQELFLSTLIPFVNDNTKKTKLDHARLIVLLKHRDIPEPLKIKISDFVKKNASGKLIVSSKYNGYQLIN